MAPSRVTIARILRPRGRVGEVAAEILTDVPERLTRLTSVFLAPENGGLPEREAAVRRCWLHKGQAIFHFAGTDSIDEAERLRGLLVQVPMEQRIALPAGKYFVDDLIGCEVVAGERIGVVRDVAFDTGTPVLVIESPRGEVLIPFAEDICRRVDVRARRIELAPPEGLLDLNER